MTDGLREVSGNDLSARLLGAALALVADRDATIEELRGVLEEIAAQSRASGSRWSAQWMRDRARGVLGTSQEERK